MVLLDHRLTTLQAVRAAAALGVVGYHIAPTGEEGGQLLYQWLFARGHIGVDLFFVLSGFLMARRVLAPASGERVALAFFLRRFFSRVAAVRFADYSFLFHFCPQQFRSVSALTGLFAHCPRSTAGAGLPHPVCGLDLEL